MLATDAQVTI